MVHGRTASRTEAPDTASDTAYNMPSVGLFIANVASGNVSQVKALLDEGVDANAQINGAPVLHLAAGNGKSEVVALLLQSGAPPDSADTRGETALHIAAYGGKPCEKALELLIKHGGNVNAVDAMGESALVKAARHGSSAGAKMLLAAGAEKDYVSGKLTALQWSVLNDNAPVYEYLASKGCKGNKHFNHVTKQDELPHVEFNYYEGHKHTPASARRA